MDAPTESRLLQLKFAVSLEPTMRYYSKFPRRITEQSAHIAFFASRLLS